MRLGFGFTKGNKGKEVGNPDASNFHSVLSLRKRTLNELAA